MAWKDIKDVSDIIDDQEWLTPVSTGVQGAVEKVYESGGVPARRLKDFLHGTWLGHPLHPVLTDVPLGGWTIALLFDLIDGARGSDELASAAQTAIGIGLLGAAGSAMTGVTDYAASGEQAPRAGLVHGALNVAATGFYLASWLARRGGKQKAGRELSVFGYALMVAAAYLGGELVYGQRIGVDHAQREELPDEWTTVLPAAKLRANKPQCVQANGIKVLLVKREGEIHAIGEVCSHLGGPLAEGKLEGDCIVCPWHGSRFNIETGAVEGGPATYVQPLFEARIKEGNIEVKAARGKEFEV